MWLRRQLEAIRASDGPVVLFGGEPYGAPYLIDALRERDRVAWVDLPQRVRDDVVGQGNALASALDRLTGEPLLPHALPFRAHLQLLKQVRNDLQPLWIAVSNAGIAPAFATALLELADHGYRPLLSFETETVPALEGLERCLVLGPDALRLTRADADLIVPTGIGRPETDRLFELSGGRFTDLITLVHEAADLPKVPVPSPIGPIRPRRQAESVDVPLAVVALQREGRRLEALELAVRGAPEMVDDLLRTAGPAYQDDGALPRLHLLLSSLPRSYRALERTLEWRFLAAFATDEWPSMTVEVDAHLAAFEAPELRARRAGTVERERGFPMAKEAVLARRTPLTLWQYGRMHPDMHQAIDALKEAVRVSEESGTPYDVARSSGTLAAKLLHAGQFQRARSWAEYALQVFDQAGLRDGARRLVLFNDLAVARILDGDLAGLRRGLEDSQASIEGSLPELAATYRGTLAWFEQASSRPEEALALMRATYEGSPRRTKARFAYQFVRCLNEFGRIDEARRVAADATELSSDAGSSARSMGLLATGMVQAVAGSADATAGLLGLVADGSLPAEQRLTAALHVLLVDAGGLQRLPDDVVEGLRALGPVAMRVLSGPPSAFHAVWEMLSPGGAPLRLEFLGRLRCRWDGREIELGPRLAETALALALHPDGISRDALIAFLAADGTRGLSPGGARATLTRLRAVLPVSDAPYRFTVPFSADILEARRHLLEERVREAITLLQGPLLPASDAVGVQEQRWMLEEELRQAALAAADPDALFDLADRLHDDLELWEAAVVALPAGDPRRALAKARLQRGHDGGIPATGAVRA